MARAIFLWEFCLTSLPSSSPPPPPDTADSARLMQPTPRPPAVSARAVVLGLVFALFFCAVTPYNDFAVAATYIAGTQFPIGALFVLFFFVFVINTILRKWRPKSAFRAGELLTMWTLMLVASGLPSSGMMRYFLPHIVAPRGLSTDTNNWQSKVWANSPSWLTVSDPEAAVAFFKGYPRGQEHIPWGAWAVPLTAWGILAGLFVLATFCIASLVRKQWIENEKFSFPLVTLPILLAEEPKPGRITPDLLRSPLLWVGFGLVTILHTVRGLHQLYPSIPNIEVSWNLMDYLKTQPYSQIGPIEAKFYPLVMGIAYLLPTEVCFSLWFFHLFYKMEILTGVVNNWDMPGPQGYGYKLFHGLQAFGGGLALLAWTSWTARRHLADVWEKATNGPRAREISDAGEMLSYRATLICLFVSYGGIALWLLLAQVPAIIIAPTLLTMTLAIVVISWVVCQAGMLFMAQPYGTLDVLSATLGTGPFKIAPFYTATRFESMFFYDTREMLAPSLLMGAKTAEVAHFDARALFRAMTAAVVLGAGVSLISSLALPYYNGGGNSLQNPFMYNVAPTRPLNFFAGASALPFKGSWTNWLHILAGFVGVFLMLFVRARFNFGLHPIGFLTASVYAMHMLWFSIFLGWVAKTLINRYGGMKVYQGALPLFLGLILGDVVNAAIWIILGYVTQVGYQLMPG